MHLDLKLPALLVFVFATSCGWAEELKETFIARNVSTRIGGYSPLRAQMVEEVNLAIKLPPNVVEAKYGRIKLGEQSWEFALSEPIDEAAQLFVDSNGDNDLSNDPPADWTKGGSSGSSTYNGSAMVHLGNGKWGNIRFYRFDPNDPKRASMANTLMYYVDFGSEINFDLDGKKFTTLVSGELRDGQSLPVNRDANKQISRYYETVKIGEPFNFTGNTYVFSLDNDRLTLQPSNEAVEQLPLPPDFSIGNSAIAFSGTELRGENLEFPNDFSGKLVMLDFWATWCGPCIAEVPHMKKAYAEWHADGFEILGVCLDSVGKRSDVEKFLADKEIDWPQVYDNDKRPTELTQQYDILGIPFVLLVDGDTGKILATSRELRGPNLSKVIEAQIKKRREAPASE
jgi:thiol-disulfide isomerase/thioredoxin